MNSPTRETPQHTCEAWPGRLAAAVVRPIFFRKLLSSVASSALVHDALGDALACCCIGEPTGA